MKHFISALLTLSLLAACSTTQPGTPAVPAPTTAAPITAAPTTAAPASELTRTDAQGAVAFAVTPLHLRAAAATLEFKVVMDTHTVDLSWDLATQARLTTDTGLEVAASQWTVGSGHHYENTLVFPAQTPDGQALLKAAKTLTLVITNTDVPERTFVWDINP